MIPRVRHFNLAPLLLSALLWSLSLELSVMGAIPLVDLASETARRTIVDREEGQYLGHPTTVLLEDGRTVLCTYPKGHGKGAIQLKRSTDGGLTWSPRLPGPENWATSPLRIGGRWFFLVAAEGRRRLGWHRGNGVGGSCPEQTRPLHGLVPR